jgi:ATP-dependent Clp protease, protease subunit
MMLFFKRWKYRRKLSEMTLRGLLPIEDLTFQDEASCTNGLAGLLYLAHIGGGKIIISSFGGTLNSGFAFTDTLRDKGDRIATHAQGMAIGPAFMVLMAGAKGQRTAEPGARLGMGQVYVPEVSDLEGPERMHSEFTRIRAQIIDLFCQRSQVDQSLAGKLVDKEYMSPQEALTHGFIDRIEDSGV